MKRVCPCFLIPISSAKYRNMEDESTFGISFSVYRNFDSGLIESVPFILTLCAKKSNMAGRKTV
jgi:hypothetical protein